LQYRSGEIGKGVQALTTMLANIYGPDHEVVLYEASQYPTVPPLIERLSLANLPTATITRASTLYVPPNATMALDHAMVAHLGLDPEGLI
jgi:hypothetical protein